MSAMSAARTSQRWCVARTCRAVIGTGHHHNVSPLIKQQFGNVSQSPPGRPWMVGH